MKRTTAAAVLLALVTLTACSSSEDDTTPAADAPPYKVTQQDDSGNQRTVTVTVESTKDLRAVFDAVADTLTDEAGYIVQIDCATVGTDKSAARLANGKVAVGNMGAATTGLEDGQTEFAALDGRTCPAK